jgi:hypothetical protein
MKNIIPISLRQCMYNPIPFALLNYLEIVRMYVVSALLFFISHFALRHVSGCDDTCKSKTFIIISGWSLSLTFNFVGSRGAFMCNSFLAQHEVDKWYLK